MRLMLAFFVVLAITLAQDQPLPLQPTLRPDKIAGETQCRPLFVKVTFAAPTIVFAYRAPDGNTRGDSVLVTQALVEIVEGKAPTYQKAVVNGRDGALFRLDRAEYEKDSACLPKPEEAR